MASSKYQQTAAALSDSGIMPSEER